MKYIAALLFFALLVTVHVFDIQRRKQNYREHKRWMAKLDEFARENERLMAKIVDFRVAGEGESK